MMMYISVCVNVCVCVCVCVCVWMMGTIPVHQAGGISTPACDPLGFHY